MAGEYAHGGIQGLLRKGSREKPVCQSGRAEDDNKLIDWARIEAFKSMV